MADNELNKIYNNYKNYKGYNKGYKTLPFFVQAEFISDGTNDFCHLYIDKKSRTFDQMIQASRSSKQCIAEAYLQKSLEGRIKLLGVSRGSYEELLNDYLDFLRQRGLRLWPKDSPEAVTIRRIAYNRYKSYKDYKIYIEKSPETAANAMICLLNQTNQLLDQKLRWTEEKFVKEGGFRENLFKKRLAHRRGF